MKIRVLKVPPSATVAINSIALEKIRAGERVYNLSAGEPMVPAPQEAEKAFIRAFKEGKTRYPAVAGVADLREAAAQWMNRRYGSRLRKENTIVVSGGKFGIYALLQALLRPGDEVLIPAPYWVSYIGMTRLFKGTPKIIPTTEEAEWKITARDLEKYRSRKSRILILNNASNPTGSLYSRAEIKAILSTATRLGLFVIADEVYSGLVYDKKEFVSFAMPGKLPANLAIIESCSKNFAMTGFRIGFVFAGEDIIKTLSSLASQSTSGATTMCQYAALAALGRAEAITKRINKEMQRRRDAFVEEFNRTFRTEIPPPAAGLYIFVPLRTMGWRGENSAEFSRLAIEKANVATVPGSAFGKEGYVRFSFGEQAENLVKGIRALARFINGYNKQS